MGKVSAYVKCPYCRKEYPQKIVCEGVTKDCTIHVTFQDSNKKKEYESRLCKKQWEQCMIAQMLNRKWDYE